MLTFAVVVTYKHSLSEVQFSSSQIFSHITSCGIVLEDYSLLTLMAYNSTVVLSRILDLRSL